MTKLDYLFIGGFGEASTRYKGVFNHGNYGL